MKIFGHLEGWQVKHNSNSKFSFGISLPQIYKSYNGFAQVLHMTNRRVELLCLTMSLLKRNLQIQLTK